ncbi:molecular chaperone Tir [Foetidibacter luteolus]|uniref:molecular chaperone Tir n=1 Tax=Foetidibacter luteolus TaxID=2608880 RepID=UPI00129ACFA4|nr:molecular chaperone Tir [Foetidibacter luteolus]
MKDYFNLVKSYLLQLQMEIRHENRQQGILVVNNVEEGIVNLILCVAPPILIFEQYIFEISGSPNGVYKALLQKNRDIIHGSFVLDETGARVIFRDTLQIENLDINEFEATLNSLSLLLSEYAGQIINFSKKHTV